MLITFKSNAAADIIMYKEHAAKILDLLDKDVERGIITKEQTADAIVILEAAIKDSRAHQVSSLAQQDIAAHHAKDENDHDHTPVESISFAARAYPLLEMLQAANQSHCDIVWGV